MSIIILPGLIDLHVHFRDPGQTEKEDFYTGTSAALAGGFTTVFDMPNNKLPITTVEKLQEKILIAEKKVVCNIGFYFGSLGDNLEEFKKLQKTICECHLGRKDKSEIRISKLETNPKYKNTKTNRNSDFKHSKIVSNFGLRASNFSSHPLASHIFGLKLYLNETTGNFLINKEKLEEIFTAWKKMNKPILLHAEDDAIDAVIKIVKRTNQQAHFCHISLQSDLEQIMRAKKEGLPITCGVTPHHLFLTEHDAKNLGPYGRMKPFLKSKKDVDFLWKNLKYIDAIESDHAPHTKVEKESDTPPFGVPGLETTLPLLLNAVHEKKLSINDVIRLCHTGPAKILHLKQDTGTVEVDIHESYILNHESLHSKCAWTPFAGRKVYGKVKKVTLNGKSVFKEGKVIAEPGSGKILAF